MARARSAAGSGVRRSLGPVREDEPCEALGLAECQKLTGEQQGAISSLNDHHVVAVIDARRFEESGAIAKAGQILPGSMSRPELVDPTEDRFGPRPNDHVRRHARRARIPVRAGVLANRIELTFVGILPDDGAYVSDTHPLTRVVCCLRGGCRPSCARSCR